MDKRSYLRLAVLFGALFLCEGRRPETEVAKDTYEMPQQEMSEEEVLQYLQAKYDGADVSGASISVSEAKESVGNDTMVTEVEFTAEDGRASLVTVSCTDLHICAVNCN